MEAKDAQTESFGWGVVWFRLSLRALINDNTVILDRDKIQEDGYDVISQRSL